MATPDLGTLSAPLPGQGQAGAAGGDSSGGNPADAGAPAPATGRESPAGKITLAKTKVSIALSMLNATLSDFEPGSREHKAVMDVTRKLAKEFAGAGAAKQLAPSEAGMLQSEAASTGAAQLNS